MLEECAVYCRVWDCLWICFKYKRIITYTCLIVTCDHLQKKLSLILFVLFSIQWNTDSKPQSLSKTSYKWICVCTQVTKVILNSDAERITAWKRERHSWHQNSYSTSLFVVYRRLEKGSSNVPIKGEVFARKDLVWVMSVCMGKVCLFLFLWEFLWGFICKVQAVRVKP